MDTMNTAFDFDDTQRLLRDSLQRWLDERFAFEQRLKLLAQPQGLQALWRGLADDLGLLGSAFAERVGGAGGGAAGHLLVMQTLGSALAGEPYLGGAVIGGGLLARCGVDAELAALIEGRLRPAWAGLEPGARHDGENPRTTLRAAGAGWRLDGRKSLVLGAPGATHFVVSAALGAGAGGGRHPREVDSGGAGGDDACLGLAWVPADAAGITRRDYRTVDGSWAAELAFDGVVLPADALLGGHGAPARAILERTLDEATLALCAEAVGVMGRLLDATIDYARQRKQFGQPIGAFQVLQHRIADMHVARLQAEALTWASLGQLDAEPAQRQRAVSSAKVMAARACRVVGQGAVQIHGGMGMTEELAVGHYFRRATMIEAQLGSLDWHLRRVERHSAAAAGD
jgi:alkylation response protein AidB-like acyl-CoA dehydrogenase